MARFSDILLTVDFDRTLTAPDSSIPRRNLEAIRYFMENGGAFTVNTGRSVPMFRRYMDIIPANAPWLLYNGSAAMENGVLTQLHPIELDVWDTLRAVEKALPDMNVELQGPDAHYCIRENPEFFRFYKSVGCAYGLAVPGMELGPFLKFSLFGQIREGSVAELFEATPEELRRMDRAEDTLRTLFGGKIEIFRAAPRIIDVHARGVSKNRAARELQARLGRKTLVCVGDAENDIPMLQGADHAFCPADGVVADRFETVCPCGRGAVADVIYEKIPGILREMA